MEKTDNYAQPPLDKYVEHLSREQIEEFYQRYLRENVDQLLKEYNIKISKNKVLRRLPPLVLEEECPNCNVPLWQERQNKIDFKENIERQKYCPKCGNTLKSILRDIELKKQFNELPDPVPQNIWDLIILASYLKAIEAKYYNPTINSNTVLPTNISFYYNPTIVLLSSCMRSSLLDYESKGCRVNLKFMGEFRDYKVHEIIETLSTLIIERIHNEQVVEIWKKHNSEECFEFYKRRFEILKLPILEDAGMMGLIRAKSANLSAAQICWMIDRGIKNTLEALREHSYPEYVANELLVEKCQYYYNFMEINEYIINPYKRNLKYFPETILGRYFFREILQLDNAFELTPNEKHLTNLL